MAEFTFREFLVSRGSNLLLPSKPVQRNYQYFFKNFKPRARSKGKSFEIN